MQTKSPPRMQVVKCDDKQEKLISFIEEHLERRMSEGDFSTRDEIQIVALSASSPVVHAIQHFVHREELRGVKIKLIVADTSSDEFLAELLAFRSISVRWAQNIRLLDAHEQLVLSDSCCWTGDCMRREPSKRDAYECFADHCEDTARWARISFERLWAVSLPIMGEDETAESDAAKAEEIVGRTATETDNNVVGTLH